ncbi:hypothetical protein RJ641_003941, partial [Dillenia turbinata]
ESLSLRWTQLDTCLTLSFTDQTEDEIIFIKGTWFPTHFNLSITDGLNAWICNGTLSLSLSLSLSRCVFSNSAIVTFTASKDEVRERASQWDQPVSDYIDFTEGYLGFQQPGSVYKFEDAGNGNKRDDAYPTAKLSPFENLLVEENEEFHHRKRNPKAIRQSQVGPDPFNQSGLKYYAQACRGGGCLANAQLSWTFEKEGTRLEWRWKCRISPNNKKTTAGILDFLMDANIRLSEEIVQKTQSFDRLKVEAEKCLAQSERFNKEKSEFENLIYAKFVKVLNSKKEKLREPRDRHAKLEATGKQPLEEENSTDKTQF